MTEQKGAPAVRAGMSMSADEVRLFEAIVTALQRGADTRVLARHKAFGGLRARVATAVKQIERARVSNEAWLSTNETRKSRAAKIRAEVLAAIEAGAKTRAQIYAACPSRTRGEVEHAKARLCKLGQVRVLGWGKSSRWTPVSVAGSACPARPGMLASK